MKKILFSSLVGALGLILSCSTSDNPVSDQPTSSVSLSVAFSRSAGDIGLQKATFGATADSLRIDSAIVVLHRIKFESHIEDVVVDTAGTDTGESDSDHEMNFTFRGPFVIHVRDTVAVTFADQVLPAGTYTGIKFKIHRLMAGEHHEDSDEHNGHHMSMDPADAVGSSIVVWGAVLKNGVWAPFTFMYDGEFEHKMMGSFEVAENVSSVNMALNFNMALWFTDPQTGSLLDPTDVTTQNRELFKQAIKRSFENGRGGHDYDHDGHPDD